MKLTLAQLNTIEDNYLQRNGAPSEFDHIHNRISRAKIRAMKKENGSCFIWTVNPWDKDDPVCREYKRGMVFNFGGSFITPKHNLHLEELLKNRLSSEYSPKGDVKKLDEIFNYADKLNRVILIWS